MKDSNCRRSASPTLDRDPKPFLFNFPGLLRNIPTLDNAAAGRGIFSIIPERDGIVRRVPMVMLAQDRLLPSLTLEMHSGGHPHEHAHDAGRQ